MNKKLLILLVFAIMALPMASACGRVAPNFPALAPPVPHAVDVRFANCNACHATDELAGVIPHQSFTNQQCIAPGCHTAGTTTTTPPPTTSTTLPTSATGTSTGTTGTAPPSSTAALLTLPDVPIAITDHNLAAITAYAGLCLVCHGPGGTNAQPTAPIWNGAANGSTHNTGIYSVPAGSKADHTGYTSATDCFQAGCHTKPTS